MQHKRHRLSLLPAFRSAVVLSSLFATVVCVAAPPDSRTDSPSIDRTAPATSEIGANAQGSSGTAVASTCFPSSAPAPEMITDALGNLVVSSKNRFISITAGDPGRPQAIRVTFTDLPGEFSGWNGRKMWVGEPILTGENGGTENVVPGFGTYYRAPLVCDVASAGFRDWSAYPVVHVFHEGIVPSTRAPFFASRYAIAVVDSTCATNLDSSFSAATIISTSVWGDTVGSYDQTRGTWTAPSGVVDMAGDAVAAIQRFSSLETAPSKVRSDIASDSTSGVPDFTLNMDDIISVLNAFSGQAYPEVPSTPAGPCAP